MAGSSHTKADFNVYLDGTRLDGATKAAISGVRVYLTHSGASAFEIVVDDPELRWQAKPTFTECKDVQIELGVPGKMKKVFDGEVTAWRTELERSGPTVMVLRGLDRSHRLMRGHKTKTYANASPIDCARQVASAAGLTAKTSAGQPAPVKTFRIQANESDYSFLRKMADLEGYLFYVEGSDLHFERAKVPSSDDVTVTFGEDLKTFLPVANFRRPAAKVEAAALRPSVSFVLFHDLERDVHLMIDATARLFDSDREPDPGEPAMPLAFSLRGGMRRGPVTVRAALGAGAAGQSAHVVPLIVHAAALFEVPFGFLGGEALGDFARSSPWQFAPELVLGTRAVQVGAALPWEASTGRFAVLVRLIWEAD